MRLAYLFISLMILWRLYLCIMTNSISNIAAHTEVIINTNNSLNQQENKIGTKLNITITSCTNSA